MFSHPTLKALAFWIFARAPGPLELKPCPVAHRTSRSSSNLEKCVH